MKLARLANITSLAGAAATLTLLTGCTYQWNDANERATFELALDDALMDGARSITISTTAGDVLLEPTDAEPRVVGKVRATTRERADATAVKAARAGEDLQISVHWPEDGREDSEGCDLLVYVPQMTGVTIDTSAGDIFIKDMGGPLKVDTSAGDIEIRTHAGDVVVRTSAGDANIWDVAGSVDIESSAGDISLHGVDAPARVITTAGDIYIRFHEGVSTRIDAKTSAGEIVIDRAEFDSDDVEHTIGEGGLTSKLRTSAGDIDVVTRPE